MPRCLFNPSRREGEVDGFANGGVVETDGAADVADAGDAGVEADAGFEEEVAVAGFELDELLVKGERGAAGAFAVVGLVERSIPDGEDGVADEFDNGAVRAVDAVEGGVKIAVEEVDEVVGVHHFADAGEVGNVGEDDADFLFDTADFAKGGVVHEFFGDGGGKEGAEGFFDEAFFRCRFGGSSRRWSKRGRSRSG